MSKKLTGAALYGVAVLGMVFSVAGVLNAAVPVEAPEVDGSLIATSLGLVSAGVLILRARLRRK